MLIVCFFLHIKSSPNLLFGVLCLPGDQSHPFAQPTINPLACCICWAGLLGRAVFPPWNEGLNSGSYTKTFPQSLGGVLSVLFFFLIVIGVQMIYNVVLVSGVKQGEYINIHLCICIYTFFSDFYHIGYYRKSIKVPCAIQQVLISYLFYV